MNNRYGGSSDENRYSARSQWDRDQDWRAARNDRSNDDERYADYWKQQESSSDRRRADERNRYYEESDFSRNDYRPLRTSGRSDSGRYETSRYGSNRYDTGMSGTDRSETSRYDSNRFDANRFDMNPYESSRFTRTSRMNDDQRAFDQRDYTGRGPKGWQRSDERIREDVCERLERDRHLDAREIDVTVKEGIVTLSGHVENRPAKRHAEDIVEAITGVKDVKNDLSIDQSLFEQAKDFFTGKNDTEEAKMKASKTTAQKTVAH